MVHKLNEFHKNKNNLQKVLLFTILFCILPFGKVLCQSNIKLNLSVGAGTYFSVISKGFLNDYNSVIGGIKQDFMHQFAPNISLIVNWNQYYSVCLNTSLIHFKLQENFSKETFAGSNQFRLLLEDFNITTFPINFRVKFSDFNSKYRSFFGIGAGIAYSKVEWKESVNTPIPNDIRVGGTIYDKKGFYPTISSQMGVELLFDKGSVPKMISGINLSTEIVYVARYDTIFERQIKQHYNNYPAFNDKHGIIPFMFGIDIGIIFNLDNTKINRVFGSNI